MRGCRPEGRLCVGVRLGLWTVNLAAKANPPDLWELPFCLDYFNPVISLLAPIPLPYRSRIAQLGMVAVQMATALCSFSGIQLKFAYD